MVDVNVNFVLEEQEPYNAEFTVNPDVTYVADMRVLTGTRDHTELYNRDVANQHPISAITGLEEALAQIPTDYVSDSELEDALLEKQDVIRDLSEIRSGAEKGKTALQSGNNISELTNNVGYITNSALNGYATENWVDGKGYLTEVPSEYVTDSELSSKGYQTASQVENAIVSKNYTTMAEVEAQGYLTEVPSEYATKSYVDNELEEKQDKLTQVQLDAVNSGANNTNIGQIAINTNDIANINTLIPNQASSSNQLADKDFVNSSISTNTANFIGTFNSVADLEAYTGTVTNNDYAFVATTDSAGNTLYDRYKWNGSEWLFEYELNNSSFTAAQWASINSLATAGKITQITTNQNAIGTLSSLTTTTKTNLVGAINELNSNKVNSNTAITGATKCKITYDGKGLVTGGADLSASDIPSLTLSKISDITATASELNVLDGITASTTELNYTDGVTSNIQTQLNGKQPTGNYVTTDTIQTINRAATKTFNGRVNFIGAGDENAIYLSTDTRIDVYGTKNTVLGFATGTFLINNPAYPLNLRGRGARPAWNSTSYLALTSDIGNATLTIQKNGTPVGSFSANSSTNTTVNITVPTDTSDLTNNAGFITNSALSPYALSADLAEVATSGDYDDLINKPTIPTVNDGILTIQANSQTVGTFTANQSGNTTVDITIPDSATWGNITGDIADQTDLQTALTTKQNLLTSENAGNCIGITTGSSSGLPAEYQEVEYLDSTGTEYIDTGITPTATKLRIVTKFQRLANAKGGDYFGSVTSTTPRAGFRLFNNTNNGNLVIQATTSIEVQASVTDMLDCDITVIQNTSCSYKINNISRTAQNNTINLTFNKSIILYGFQFGNNVTVNSIPQRFWGFTVYKEDALVQNLVPARRKSDSVLGMYDTVSGDFLTNAGTGTFIAGQDVEETTKISFVNNAGYITGSDLTPYALNDEVVHNTGTEDIGGSKTFTSAISQNITESSQGRIITTLNDIQVGTSNPQENYMAGMVTKDGDGNEFANINTQYRTDGQIRAYFFVTNPVTGGGQQLGIINSGGVSWGYAPNSDVNGSIITTVSNLKSSNGYFKLGNGLIVQWGGGSVAANASSATITFPTPFTTTNYTPVPIHNGGVNALSISTRTTTSFVVNYSQTSTSIRYFYWQAIGY